VHPTSSSTQAWSAWPAGYRPTTPSGLLDDRGVRGSERRVQCFCWVRQWGVGAGRSLRSAPIWLRSARVLSRRSASLGYWPGRRSVDHSLRQGLPGIPTAPSRGLSRLSEASKTRSGLGAWGVRGVRVAAGGGCVGLWRWTPWVAGPAVVVTGPVEGEPGPARPTAGTATGPTTTTAATALSARIPFCHRRRPRPPILSCGPCRTRTSVGGSLPSGGSAITVTRGRCRPSASSPRTRRGAGAGGSGSPGAHRADRSGPGPSSAVAPPPVTGAGRGPAHPARSPARSGWVGRHLRRRSGPDGLTATQAAFPAGGFRARADGF